MAHYFRLKIPRRWQGIPLCQLFPQIVPQASIEQWQQRWQEGCVHLQGKVPAWEQSVSHGELLEYWLENYQEPEVPSDWSVLWENDQLVAVHKPAGLSVSRTTRNPTQHLLGMVQAGGFPDAHLIHRLDKETSGIIVLAKDQNAAAFWQPQLKTLLQEKVYLAKVWGVPDWTHKQFRCLLGTREDSPIRCQMHRVGEDESGQLSETHFEVVQALDGYALVRCHLLTGRKHQIRAHLALLGHPIVGDKIYSNSGNFYLKRLNDQLTSLDWEELGSDNHCLHAFLVVLNAGEKVIKIKDEHFFFMKEI